MAPEDLVFVEEVELRGRRTHTSIWALAEEPTESPDGAPPADAAQPPSPAPPGDAAVPQPETS